MKFSIIVPLYKVDDYIDACVNSVLNQDCKDFEMILVDDGSPDKSGEIADKYARENDNVTVIHQKNRGLSAARNAGMDRAVGEYIILLDSDDTLISGSLQALSDHINGNADIYYANVVRVKQGSPNEIKHKGNLTVGRVYSGVEALRLELSTGTKFMAMAQAGIYRRIFLESNGLKFKEGILHEDEEWSPRIELCASRIVYLNIDFYCYLIREGSITNSTKKIRNAKDLMSTCLELKIIYSTLSNPELKRSLECYLAKLYLHAVSVLLRENEHVEIDKTLVRHREITKKDKIRFALFIISPLFYAKVIDKRFVNQ